MEITVPDARRLAVARAGLLRPERTGLPTRASAGGTRGRHAASRVIERFGYLQLDSVCVSGARSHALVLMSRLDGMDGELPERLLQPRAPIFEYWGHEASWLPIELYPAFEFRRREFCVHPWWGDLLGEHRSLADQLRARLRDEGPLRSKDLREAGGSGSWWGWSAARKVMAALWSSGEVAVSRRIGFQREYDLAARVIPEKFRAAPLSLQESLRCLLLRALAGHGWASTATLRATWRLKGLAAEVDAALHLLEEEGRVVRCDLVTAATRRPGWIRPEDRELAGRLERSRPRRDRGVLLSPFDPLLWDRARVALLFGFEQFIEIYKRPQDRVYGYYCLPVLAGDRLVGRVDLRADRDARELRLLSAHAEPGSASRAAMAGAVDRHGKALGLHPTQLEALDSM